MQVSREILNPCTVKLSIVCDPKEVSEGFDSAFRHLTKKVRLPGFRPGKAPRSMLEPYLDPQEWTDQAGEELVRKLYPKAVEDERMEIDRTTVPHVTVVSINKDEKTFEFSVKVPLPPKVELGEYKGLPLFQPEVEVTDAELEYELEELRKRGSTHAPVTDRGVSEGDMAILKIKPEDAEGDGETMVTIAGKNFPALDEAIMGMKVEELKNVELSFPEDFQQKDLAGKDLKVQITLNSISGVSLPVLDDAFAQSLKTENVDDLRNRLREIIGTAKQQMVRQMVHERLVDELMRRSEVAVSDNMWENLAERRISELAEEQASKGKSLQTYVEENGMSLEEFAKAWQDKAKLEVERALLIQAIYTKEDMKIENQDLNQELFTMAQEYEMPVPDLLEELKKSNALEELHFRALTRKVGDFLLSNADVTMGDPPAEAAALPEGTEAVAEEKVAKPKKAKAAKATEEEATPVEAVEGEASEEKPKAKKKAAPKATE